MMHADPMGKPKYRYLVQCSDVELGDWKTRTKQMEYISAMADGNFMNRKYPHLFIRVVDLESDFEDVPDQIALWRPKNAPLPRITSPVAKNFERERMKQKRMTDNP
ncbi:MAG: hypothetical protein ISN29_09680 [Gammaproteobacteria bacterium AqS3]|nr:hypothetical protein [Gammaproteobacteria bacterium AqS3]